MKKNETKKSHATVPLNNDGKKNQMRGFVLKKDLPSTDA
jgi:hypothetical protein